mmetsp:Transcript_35850/g.59768  ORF Transcript_35850/g.59768 Transcript_35850/m.59768 type:complete len:275 (+) Transcript_35850:60-884(+)
MGVKKRKADEERSSIASSVSEDFDDKENLKISGILEELEVEVESRAQKIMTFAEERAMEIGNAFHVQLMKLPKKIRTMTILEFCNTYSGDVNSVIFSDVNSMVNEFYSQTPGGKRFMSLRTPKTAKDVPVPMFSTLPYPGSAAASKAKALPSNAKSRPSTAKRGGKQKAEAVEPADSVDENDDASSTTSSNQGNKKQKPPTRYNLRGAKPAAGGAKSASSEAVAAPQSVDSVLQSIMHDAASKHSNKEARAAALAKLKNLQQDISALLTAYAAE